MRGGGGSVCVWGGGSGDAGYDMMYFYPCCFYLPPLAGLYYYTLCKAAGHIWRLPLTAAANNAVVLGAQLRIHSPPQVAIHIKTSKDMRGRAHIKA